MRQFLYFISIFLVLNAIPFAGSPQSVKGKSLKVHTIRLDKKRTKKEAMPGIREAAFLASTVRELACMEMQEAFRAMEEAVEVQPRWIKVDELDNKKGILKPGSLLWIHGGDSVAVSVLMNNHKVRQAVLAWLESGGRLYLTGSSVHLVNALGLEPIPVKDSLKRCFDDGYGRRLGVHSFRDHPIFNRLNGGAYLLRPEEDIYFPVTGFFGESVPEKGKVIGVDWDYIFLREDSKLVLEYDPGAGKVIAAGGYVKFTIPNLNRRHLDRFNRNVFEYLSGSYTGEAHYWDYGPNVVSDCISVNGKEDADFQPIPGAMQWPVVPDPMDIVRSLGGSESWDVGGERLVTMGRESGGIEEVWVHPYMAFRDYEAGIRAEGIDTIVWLSDLHPEVTVNPAYFMRKYILGSTIIREIIVNDPKEPAGVVHYETEGPGECWLTVRIKSNLRLMWPYSEEVIREICHGWDNSLNAFIIKDRSGDYGLMFGANQKPVSIQRCQGDGFIIQAGATWRLAKSGKLDVVFYASSGREEVIPRGFEQVLRNPLAVYHRALEHFRYLFANRLMITSPDPDFNKGYRWALVGTDRFFVHTPGMGKALVAGYSTTRRGWDGGHKVNGRPGYAWYFGRDGAWSGLALLDAGGFEMVRDNLLFFQRYQDLNGKILHEASTSGFIHYDAADATPLYILLAGRYFRHTRDTAFLRQSWNSIRNAIGFCFSTDTDNDHLIENTNVGHGWVEGGELYGSHSTLYMAGCWSAALMESAVMSRQMGDPEADRYAAEAREQQRIINHYFWDPAGNFYSYGMNRDRSLRTDPTVLPSVPLLFGLGDKEKALKVLRVWASNRFTTNWGVRILGDDSQWFKPTGYHYGSVWPLFTGWTALAEYRYGQDVTGFTHLMNNLSVYRNWSLGYVEEVINGAVYKPTGVCPHQCWSETMVLQPAIEGILGLEVDAVENRIILSPALPAHWDSLRVDGIRMAETKIQYSYRRDSAGSTYSFEITEGNPFNLAFLPVFPPGSVITGVTLDNKEYPFTILKTMQGIKLKTEINLNRRSEIRISHHSGIAALPVVPDPKPGDSSAGFRIISSMLSGNQYIIEVEGVRGTTGRLNVYSNGMEIIRSDNATFHGITGKILHYEVNFPKEEPRYISRQIVLELSP